MIEIKDLSLELGKFSLNKINLFIGSGEFFTLLGPTGSGKTVLLECIAGLRPVKSGSIILDRRDITNRKPEERNIAICYQDYALFPHMNVRNNIKYGLQFKKDRDDPKYQRNFDMLVELLKIDHILDRYPVYLSGGEKQRVALARALIIDPIILLLDEPLSALDANIRESIEKELKNIHRALKITTIMVTHNFSEAYFLASRVGILREGTILQTGPPREVFEKPQSIFVAKFVGMKNLFKIDFNHNSEFCRQMKLKFNRLPAGGNIGIRPENILIDNNKLTTEFCFKGIIQKIRKHGVYMEIDIAGMNENFISCLTSNRCYELDLCQGKEIFFGFDAKHINIIPNEFSEFSEFRTDA